MAGYPRGLSHHTDTRMRFSLDTTDIQEDTDPGINDGVYREEGQIHHDEKTDGPTLPTP